MDPSILGAVLVIAGVALLLMPPPPPLVFVLNPDNPTPPGAP